MSDAFSIGSIGGKWNILRAGGGNDGLEVPSLPLEITTAAGPIRMAVGSHGEARLLIPLGKGARLPSIEPGPALGVGLSTFTHRGRATTYLDLVCLSAELESVFAELVHELLRRIAKVLLLRSPYRRRSMTFAPCLWLNQTVLPRRAESRD